MRQGLETTGYPIHGFAIRSATVGRVTKFAGEPDATNFVPVCTVVGAGRETAGPLARDTRLECTSVRRALSFRDDQTVVLRAADAITYRSVQVRIADLSTWVCVEEWDAGEPSAD